MKVRELLSPMNGWNFSAPISREYETSKRSSLLYAVGLYLNTSKTRVDCDINMPRTRCSPVAMS